MQNYDRTLELIDASQNSTGKSTEQFAKYSDTLEAKWKKMQNTFEQFYTSENMTNLIKGIVDQLTSLGDKIKDLNPVRLLAQVVAGIMSVRRVLNTVPQAGSFISGKIDRATNRNKQDAYDAYEDKTEAEKQNEQNKVIPITQHKGFTEKDYFPEFQSKNKKQNTQQVIQDYFTQEEEWNRKINEEDKQQKLKNNELVAEDRKEKEQKVSAEITDAEKTKKIATNNNNSKMPNPGFNDKNIINNSQSIIDNDITQRSQQALSKIKISASETVEQSLDQWTAQTIAKIDEIDKKTAEINNKDLQQKKEINTEVAADAKTKTETNNKELIAQLKTELQTLETEWATFTKGKKASNIPDSRRSSYATQKETINNKLFALGADPYSELETSPLDDRAKAILAKIQQENKELLAEVETTSTSTIGTVSEKAETKTKEVATQIKSEISSAIMQAAEAFDLVIKNNKNKPLLSIDKIGDNTITNPRRLLSYDSNIELGSGNGTAKVIKSGKRGKRNIFIPDGQMSLFGNDEEQTKQKSQIIHTIEEVESEEKAANERTAKQFETEYRKSIENIKEQYDKALGEYYNSWNTRALNTGIKQIKQLSKPPHQEGQNGWTMTDRADIIKQSTPTFISNNKIKNLNKNNKAFLKQINQFDTTGSIYDAKNASGDWAGKQITTYEQLYNYIKEQENAVGKQKETLLNRVAEIEKQNNLSIIQEKQNLDAETAQKKLIEENSTTSAIAANLQETFLPAIIQTTEKAQQSVGTVHEDIQTDIKTDETIAEQAVDNTAATAKQAVNNTTEATKSAINNASAAAKEFQYTYQTTAKEPLGFQTGGTYKKAGLTKNSQVANPMVDETGNVVRTGDGRILSNYVGEAAKKPSKSLARSSGWTQIGMAFGMTLSSGIMSAINTTNWKDFWISSGPLVGMNLAMDVFSGQWIKAIADIAAQGIAAGISAIKIELDKINTQSQLATFSQEADTLSALNDKLKDEVSTAQADTKEQQDKANTLQDISDIYDKLKGKINLTEDEQTEYNTMVESVKSQFPSLISGYDEVNNRITLNKTALQEQLDIQTKQTEKLKEQEAILSGVQTIIQGKTDNNSNLINSLKSNTLDIGSTQFTTGAGNIFTSLFDDSYSYGAGKKQSNTTAIDYITANGGSIQDFFKNNSDIQTFLKNFSSDLEAAGVQLDLFKTKITETPNELSNPGQSGINGSGAEGKVQGTGIFRIFLDQLATEFQSNIPTLKQSEVYKKAYDALLAVQSGDQAIQSYVNKLSDLTDEQKKDLINNINQIGQDYQAIANAAETQKEIEKQSKEINASTTQNSIQEYISSDKDLKNSDAANSILGALAYNWGKENTVGDVIDANGIGGVLTGSISQDNQKQYTDIINSLDIDDITKKALQAKIDVLNESLAKDITEKWSKKDKITWADVTDSENGTALKQALIQYGISTEQQFATAFGKDGTDITGIVDRLNSQLQSTIDSAWSQGIIDKVKADPNAITDLNAVFQDDSITLDDSIKKYTEILERVGVSGEDAIAAAKKAQEDAVNAENELNDQGFSDITSNMTASQVTSMDTNYNEIRQSYENAGFDKDYAIEKAKENVEAVRDWIKTQSSNENLMSTLLGLDQGTFNDEDYASALDEIAEQITDQCPDIGKTAAIKIAQGFMQQESLNGGLFDFGITADSIDQSISIMADSAKKTMGELEKTVKGFKDDVSGIFQDVTDNGYFDFTDLSGFMDYLDTIGLKLEDVLDFDDKGNMTLSAKSMQTIEQAAENTAFAQGDALDSITQQAKAEALSAQLKINEAATQSTLTEATGETEAATEDTNNQTIDATQSAEQLSLQWSDVADNTNASASNAYALANGEQPTAKGKHTKANTPKKTTEQNRTKVGNKYKSDNDKYKGITFTKQKNGDYRVAQANGYSEKDLSSEAQQLIAWQAAVDRYVDQKDQLDKIQKKYGNIDQAAANQIAREAADSKIKSSDKSSSSSSSSKDTDDLQDDVDDAQKDVDDARESLAEAAKALKEAKEGTDDWIESIDRLINYTTRLTNISQKLDNISTKLENVSSTDDAYKALTDQAVLRGNQTNLKTAENQKYQQAIQERLQQFQTRSWQGINYSNFLETYDDGSYGIKTNELQKAAIPDDIADQLNTMVEEMNTYSQEILKNENDIAELENTRLSEHKQYLEDYVSMQDKVTETLKNNAEEEVENEKNKYEALEEADNDYLDALEKAISKQRALRDEQSNYNNLAQQEAKLALMERDTSNSNSSTKEIADQRASVQSTRQELLDNKVDTIVDNLKDMYDTQKEGRDALIEIKEKVIEEADENNIFNQQAAEIVKGWTNVDDAKAWFLENDSNLNGETVEAVEKEMLDIQDTMSGALSHVAEQQVVSNGNVEAKMTSVEQYAQTTSESLTGSAERALNLAEKDAQEAIKDAQDAYDDALDDLNDKLEALQDAVDALNNSATELAANAATGTDTRGTEEPEEPEKDNTGTSKARYTYNQLQAINAKDSNAFNNVLKAIGQGKATPSGFTTGTMASAQKAWQETGKTSAVWSVLKSSHQAQETTIKKNKYNANNHPTGAGDSTNKYDKKTTLKQKDTNLNDAQYEKYIMYMNKDSKRTGDSSTQTYQYNGKTYSGITFKREKDGTVKYALWKGENMGKYKKVSKYAQGGLVDYTGPAWVDGTKSSPEAFLSASDTSNIQGLTTMLSALSSKISLNAATADSIAENITNSNQSIGDMNFNIDLNIENMSSDYDVEDMVSKMKDEIAKAANPIGTNVMINR